MAAAPVLEDGGRKLEDFYDLGDVLGRGSFSIVRMAKAKSTGVAYACKHIDKLSIHNRQRLANEINILRKVDHPYVIKLHDIFETDRYLYLITDLALGGELFDRVVDKGHYSEQEASVVISRMLDAIKYLHSLGVIHRDIKPENILLSSVEEDLEVKMSDFGLAKIFSADENEQAQALMTRSRAYTVCGTDYYVAPEVLQQAGYTNSCDLWSIGVVLYILLSGCPPFYDGGDVDMSVQRKIMLGKYSFPDPYWTNVSAEAKDLVKNMLHVDPTLRFTAEQCLEHPWITKHGLSSDPLPIANFDALKKFNDRRKSSVMSPVGSPMDASFFGSSPMDAEMKAFSPSPGGGFREP